MIEVTNLNFAYDKKSAPVLTDINLQIEEKQWLAIIGRNGSGKSTFARHLNGLLLPQSGKVLVDGLDTADSQQLDLVREKVAFVFQNPDNQFIAASVEDDIAFGLENLGLPREEISERMEQALTALNLTALRTKEPHLLSGGEKQRVALAGALAMAGKYLVLDEPTAMLDPQMRQAVIESLHMMHEQMGMTIVFVTNIMEEVLLADRVVVMDEGMIAKDGKPREIFADAGWLIEKGLDLPQICQMATMLEEAGYSQFKGIIYPEELIERVLWLK